MFERLMEIVENTPVPSSADAALELVRIVDRLNTKATLAVARAEAEGSWALDGDVSVTAWLRRAGALSTKDAARVARIASRLRDLPETAARYEAGQLNTGQVGAITANVTDRTAALFAEQEQEMLPVLVPLSPADCAIVMRRWAAAAEDALNKDKPGADEGDENPRRELRVSATLDGRRELSGSFDAAGGALVEAGLRMASTYGGEDDHRSAAERRADALLEIFRKYLETHDAPRRNRNRPRVEVRIDLADLEARRGARLFDGTTLDAAATRSLLCDCEINRVVTDGPGVVLDFGRTTRLVPRGQWDALVARDRGCREPGCDRPAHWCEAHHVIPWELGGTTDLSNLVLKCTRHHHMGHMPGWHDKLRPDGTYVVTTPTGRVLESRPPP